MRFENDPKTVGVKLINIQPRHKRNLWLFFCNVLYFSMSRFRYDFLCLAQIKTEVKLLMSEAIITKKAEQVAIAEK